MAGIENAGKATVTDVETLSDGVNYLIKAIHDESSTRFEWLTEVPPKVGDQIRFSLRWTILDGD